MARTKQWYTFGALKDVIDDYNDNIIKIKVVDIKKTRPGDKYNGAGYDLRFKITTTDDYYNKLLNIRTDSHKFVGWQPDEQDLKEYLEQYLNKRIKPKAVKITHEYTEKKRIDMKTEQKIKVPDGLTKQLKQDGITGIYIRDFISWSTDIYGVKEWDDNTWENGCDMRGVYLRKIEQGLARWWSRLASYSQLRSFYDGNTLSLHAEDNLKVFLTD